MKEEKDGREGKKEEEEIPAGQGWQYRYMYMCWL